MGSSNSGRRGGKRTTGDMWALDIRGIEHAGRLTAGLSFNWQWSRRGTVVANIQIHTDSDRVTLDYRTKQRDGTWLAMNYPVMIQRTACHFGGQRAWWVCPHCGRRVAVLYGGQRYACRHCQQLTYQSTRNSPDTQAFARADKVRARLGWVAGIANPVGDKPKGMHHQTYERWLLRYYTLSNQAWGESSATLDKMMGRLRCLYVKQTDVL